MNREIPSTTRYQRLETSSSDEEAEDCPPSYDQCQQEEPSRGSNPPTEIATTSLQQEEPKEEYSPPSYEASTVLPSYDDVKKHKEDIARREIVDLIFNIRPSSQEEDDEPRIDGITVGNDCVFLCAFILGFLLNWIGLFIGYFVIFNLSGRYGSLAGFGISTIKWLMLVKYSGCCQNYFLNQHDYAWWIFCFLALTMFFRGLCSWISIRKLQRFRQSSDQAVLLE